MQHTQHEEYDVDGDSRNSNGKQIEHAKSVKFYSINLLLGLTHSTVTNFLVESLSVAEREIARRIWHHTEYFLFEE